MYHRRASQARAATIVQPSLKNSCAPRPCFVDATPPPTLLSAGCARAQCPAIRLPAAPAHTTGRIARLIQGTVGAALVSQCHQGLRDAHAATSAYHHLATNSTGWLPRQRPSSIPNTRRTDTLARSRGARGHWIRALHLRVLATTRKPPARSRDTTTRPPESAGRTIYSASITSTASLIASAPVRTAQRANLQLAQVVPSRHIRIITHPTVFR